jgi:hypothetical protein
MVATVRGCIACEDQILIAERELQPNEIRKAQALSSAGVRIIDRGCRNAARLEVDGGGSLLPFLRS